MPNSEEERTSDVATFVAAPRAQHWLQCPVPASARAAAVSTPYYNTTLWYNTFNDNPFRQAEFEACRLSASVKNKSTGQWEPTAYGTLCWKW